MRAVLPPYRRYVHLPARNAFTVNPSKSKRQMLLKLRLHLKSAQYVLEIDDKSSFSMSGHVGPLAANQTYMYE